MQPMMAVLASAVALPAGQWALQERGSALALASAELAW